MLWLRRLPLAPNATASGLELTLGWFALLLLTYMLLSGGA